MTAQADDLQKMRESSLSVWNEVIYLYEFQPSGTVYKNPELIIFDEATSSLDTVNERYIMDNLQQFFRERTVIVVAHRLSTVVNADNIIYLEDGKIAEQGTHKELVELKGKYYELIKNQLELER